MIDDPHKQYIEDFSFHNQDLNYILNNLVYNNFNGPFIGIGHSMGGCIILNALKENNQLFDHHPARIKKIVKGKLYDFAI